jgi:hypothetical protein
LPAPTIEEILEEVKEKDPEGEFDEKRLPLTNVTFLKEHRVKPIAPPVETVNPC